MNSRLSNPYIYILSLPLLLFLAMVAVQVLPDNISVPVRALLFACLAYVTARYAGRNPRLMWEGNFSPEARNIVGWGLFLVSQMLTQCYAILNITLDRPEWLASTYYSPAFASLGLVGLVLVASSIPKFPVPPFFSNGRGVSASVSFLFAALSAGGLFLVSHLPAALKALASLFSALVHAV